jgi:hypothetical protein
MAQQNSSVAEFVALVDLQAEQVRVVLENLKIPQLVAPFESNHVDGALLNLVESPEDIVDIDSSLIKGIFARSFFQQLKAWKEDGGRVPMRLLVTSQPPVSTATPTKVSS